MRKTKNGITILLMALALTLIVLSFFDSSRIVKASSSPGISVTIQDIDPIAALHLTDTEASYIVKIESITTEFEEANLVVSGDPSLSFSWTLQEFSLAPGEIREFPLEVTVASGTPPGDYPFTALGSAWLPFLPEFPETSSYTSHVNVPAPPPPPVGGVEITWPMKEDNSLATWISLALITMALMVILVKIQKIEK